MPLPFDSFSSPASMDVHPDKPEEACGVFAVFSPTDDVATLTYFGLYALQHRGQESAGIATFDHGSINIHKDMGLVSQVFDEEVLERLPGQWAVGHTRYSTTGSSRVDNAQPAILSTRLGEMALAHNGNVVNAAKLREEILKRDHTLVTTTDTELIALFMADAVNDGKDWIEAAVDACKRCEGAFSLTIATPEGILAIRDPNGIRPLVLGYVGGDDPNNGPGRYAVASETCGLDIVNAHYMRDVQPGELLWISDMGIKSVQWAQPERRLCIFEMVYFARPDSVYHGESLYSYRKRLGNILAQESPADVDLIMPVPDSGIPAAIGFAESSGIPYAEGLIKNRYVGRTFIQPTQAMRETGIRMKLNPMRDVLEGKRILIVDDSITVRELLSMSFNKVGYRVEQARDGQEAWEKLRSGLPCDLVFCDIEMPRMDGLELLSRLQKDDGLQQIPIAMLTSRGADRHRQMAVDLGASGYFTKPYLEEALLDAANKMLHGEKLV